MAITYPLNIPTTIGIEQIEFRSKNVVAVSESPFTYAQQVYQHPGQAWEVTVRIPPVKSDLANEWVAFLLSLKGQRGTFLLGDPNMVDPRGTAKDTPGTPVVNGASQTGSSLNIDGLPTNETGYLLPGDYIQLGSGSSTTLHMVLQQVDSNGSGEATLELWPDIRFSPSDNATVTVSDTKGHFRLKNNVSSWTINSISSYGIQFEAMEVISV